MRLFKLISKSEAHNIKNLSTHYSFYFKTKTRHILLNFYASQNCMQLKNVGKVCCIFALLETPKFFLLLANTCVYACNFDKNRVIKDT